MANKDNRQQETHTHTHALKSALCYYEQCKGGLALIKNGATLDARNPLSVAAAVPRGVTLVSLPADGRGICIVCTKSLSLLNCKKNNKYKQPPATSHIRDTK